jgi:arylsulfatase A-like enzyme
MATVSRREFLASSLALSLGAALHGAPNQPLKQGDAPNILMIAVDDLNDWIGPLAGHPQTTTPNLNAFAKKAMVFDRAYCAAPLCNPSRTSLMTGIRPGRSGVYGNNHLFRTSPVLKDALTIPQYFHEHGYYTASKGKIFHHPQGMWADEGSWEKHNRLTGDGMGRHPGATKDKLNNGLPRIPGALNNMDWGGLDVPIEETSDYQNATWAVDELNREHARPFFVACGIFRPHMPWFVPQKNFDRFPLETIKNTRIDEHDLDDIPAAGKKVSGGLYRNSDYQKLKKHGLLTAATRAYLACINYADECIGAVLDGLEKSPYRDNTIVFLWGDHGWHLGEKLHYRKMTLWEEATRAPLYWYVPGMTQPGSRCRRTVDYTCFYPTLIELCGLPKKPDLDGRSIVPLLKDAATPWPYPAITTRLKNQHGVRSERWRYIRYEDGSEELYDHSVDEWEATNLASDPKYQPVIAERRTWLPTENADPIEPTDKGRHTKAGGKPKPGSGAVVGGAQRGIRTRQNAAKGGAGRGPEFLSDLPVGLYHNKGPSFSLQPLYSPAVDAYTFLYPNPNVRWGFNDRDLTSISINGKPGNEISFPNPGTVTVQLEYRDGRQRTIVIEQTRGE